MTTASRAHPELVGPPRRSRGRIRQLHLLAAALTDDSEFGINHPAILTRRPTRRADPDGAPGRDAVIPAIILAAGASSRMGRPKALLPIPAESTTFLERLVQTLRDAGADDIIVVVGYDAGAVRGLIESAGLAVRTVENQDPSRGQLSSLVAALEVADRPGVQGVLVAPVDQPLVAAETVKRLLGVYRRTPAPAVRPTRGDRHGHPVILDRSLFDELRRADLSSGAREVIRRHGSEVIDVTVDDEGAFLDIDTPEEYEGAMRKKGFGSRLR